jgi:hypothetical protein
MVFKGLWSAGTSRTGCCSYIPLYKFNHLTSIAPGATIFHMLRSLQIFSTKSFARWMQKNRVSGTDLITATKEMARGLIDADLGGHVIKKRVALQGRGKRSGARTIVATKFGRRWVYLFGFEKNERANIDSNELKALQELAKTYLELNETETRAAIEAGKLIEINGEE